MMVCICVYTIFVQNKTSTQHFIQQFLLIRAFDTDFTGHGGAEAATFAKEHLINLIVNQKAFWSDDDRDVLRAIREGYIATHYAMWREQGKSFTKNHKSNSECTIAKTFQVKCLNRIV